MCFVFADILDQVFTYVNAHSFTLTLNNKVFITWKYYNLYIHTSLGGKQFVHFIPNVPIFWYYKQWHNKLLCVFFGIISFCTNEWVCPGCGPRSGVIGVGNAYSSSHDSISFEPLCPYLAIMSISPERGTPGTEDKIRRCHPWKHKLLDISSQFRPECLLWAGLCVGLWSRCSLGT